MPFTPLKHTIAKYRWLYQIGLQGPDIFFYNIPILRHRDYRNVGSHMHEYHVNRFFRNCLNEIAAISSKQQREQARRTDLAAFLRQCGEEVKRSGSENMWLDHGQKVTIRGNLWFHQYEQVGGDAIDFACRFYNMGYPEAVQLMLAMGAGTVLKPVEPFAQKPLEIPQKHENMRRVYGYLLRHRGIDKEVLDAFS